MDDTELAGNRGLRDVMVAEQAAIIVERDATIARLTGALTQAQVRIGELEAMIEKIRRGGKRQAAPFSKGSPRLNPKKPGRKPGEGYGTPPTFRSMPAPSPTDQVIDVASPAVCPGCGDSSERIVETIDEQVQRDIEVRTVVRRFRRKVCRCANCGRRLCGRHPLQTSTARGCCASQIGPLARSAMAFMHNVLGLSMGKTASLFQTLWGLDVTRGGVSQAIATLGAKCDEAHRSIIDAVRASTTLTCDETGWRVGGLGAWMHAAATKDAVVYHIDPARGRDATDKLIGENYAGTMIHDGWSSYDCYEGARHQSCLAHLLRRCQEMLETATGGAVVFPRRIKQLLKRALELRDQRAAGTRSLRSTRIHATKLTRQIRRLCEPKKRNQANGRLARFLHRHADELFTFLRDPEVDATNWRGEHAMRGAVVNRKVWGGNRTWRGATTQCRLLTLFSTLRLRELNPIAWLEKTLHQQNPPLMR